MPFLSLLLNFVMFGVCAFIRYIALSPQGCDAILPGPLVFILTLFGVFEGLLFSLFTCIMFGTQVHSIATDETVSWGGGGGGARSSFALLTTAGLHCSRTTCIVGH